MKDELYIELNSYQVKKSDLIKMSKDLWISKGNKVKDLKKLDMYYKPDEKKCYCVFNDTPDDSFFEV